MEAFIWMFKKKDYMKQFLIFMVTILVLIISAMLIYYNIIVDIKNSSSINFMFYFKPVFSLFLVALPLLIIIGYFFKLTLNVIQRKYTQELSNIYDGIMSKNCEIELPKLNLFSLALKGIGAVIAMIVPITAVSGLFYISFVHGNAHELPLPVWIFIIVFLLFLIPALLWNYAKENTLFSMINLSKSVYIIGNYFFNYIKTIIALLFASTISSIISHFTITTFGSTNLAIKTLDIMHINFFIALSLDYILIVYLTFVYAYIIGTIAPIEEA